MGSVISVGWSKTKKTKVVGLDHVCAGLPETEKCFFLVVVCIPHFGQSIHI